MASQWFCKIAGHERGPLSAQALKSMADKGRIQPDDPVRQGADGSWVPAGRVKGLFPSDQAAPTQQASVQQAKSEPVSDSQAVLKAKPLEEELPQATQSKAPAKMPPKAKPAAPRVAKPLEEPPAVPEEKPAEPAAKVPPPVGTPVQAGPVEAEAAASDQFAFIGAESSPAARGIGRAGSAVPTAKKKKPGNMMLVGGLLLAIVALCVIAAAVMMSGKDPETAKASGDKGAGAKSFEEEDIIDTEGAAEEKPKEAGSGSGTAEEPSTTDGETQAEGEWADASKESIKRGDVRVKVVSAQIGRPRMLKSTGRGARPKTEALVVKLELQNTNATKKLEYKSWGDRNVGVSLTDNFDNKYTQKTKKTYGGALVEGQDDSGSIYPGKSLVDAVIFEPPIDKAEFLRLELPAISFGASGRLNFQIPVSMIEEMPEESAEEEGRPPWEAAASPLGRALDKANTGEKPLPPGRGVPAIDKSIDDLENRDKPGKEEEEHDPFAEGAENDKDPDGDVSKIMNDIDETGGGDKKSDKDADKEKPAREKKSPKRREKR